MAVVEVEVEYCGAWGYRPKYEELAREIRAAIPDAKVSGKVGRRSSFEIKVNGFEIHSKLKTMAWPDPTDVLDIVQDVADGQEPRVVKKHLSGSSCVIC